MRCFSYIYSPLVMGLVEKPYRSVMAGDSFSLDSLYLHCIGTRCEYPVNWFTAFQHILDIYYVTLRNIVSECYYTRTYMARILYSHFFSLNIILTCYEGNIIGQKNTYITDTVRVRMILIDFAAKDKWNACYPCWT